MQTSYTYLVVRNKRYVLDRNNNVYRNLETPLDLDILAIQLKYIYPLFIKFTKSLLQIQIRFVFSFSSIFLLIFMFLRRNNSKDFSRNLFRYTNYVFRCYFSKFNLFHLKKIWLIRVYLNHIQRLLWNQYKFHCLQWQKSLFCLIGYDWISV